MIHSQLLLEIPNIRHGYTTKNTPAEEREILRTETISARQIHTDNLIWVQAPLTAPHDADALATTHHGLNVGVYTADCTPILVAALNAQREATAVMAVHAGWRGTAMQIAEKSLENFIARVGDFHSLAVSIGPCISLESFEVGEDVILAFPHAISHGLARFDRMEGAQKKYYFDLVGENRRQLENAAHKAKALLALDLPTQCTVQNTDLYSFRREKDINGRGRSLAFIGIV